MGEIEKKGERYWRDGANRHRDRADNKNPKQSWVAQLVYYINVKLPNLDLKQEIYLEG